MADTVAFVIPWFGPAATGGAESECRATARALARHGLPVEVLTTCALGLGAEWRDHHPPGVTEEDGLVVRRFPVRPRDADTYLRYQVRLELGGRLEPWEERAFVAHSVHSDALYAHLRAHRERSWYLFLPYCFGTTWEGVLAVPERAIVIPCLHDEPYAAFAATRRALAAARAVALHVPAERALAERVLAGQPATLVEVGEGVDTDVPPGDPARFRRRYRVERPFLLYAGRKAREKNVPVLLDYFARYRLTHPRRPLALVLIGPGQVRIPGRLCRDILDLGYLPPEDRRDAFAAALAVVQPSLLESFSLVLMEAWLAGRPVLVHGGCAVTREHCRRSGGGLWFEEYFEFVEAVERLQDDPGLREALAARGRAYVLAHYTWERVVASYVSLLRGLGAELP